MEHLYLHFYLGLGEIMDIGLCGVLYVLEIGFLELGLIYFCGECNKMSVINTIINDDVLVGLKQIPDGVVSLVVSSPPYNTGGRTLRYDNYDDNISYLDYLIWLKSVFIECKRVLRTGGRFCINIDAIRNREDGDDKKCYIRDIRTDLCNIMKEIGMMFFGEHIWFKNGQWSGKKTSWGSYKSCSFPTVQRSFEYILIYSKEQFRLEKNNESLDSDITAKEFQIYIDSTWSIQPETQNRCGHPAVFPLELPMRCIKLYSYPNDVILDCFAGTGTTLLAAKKLKRRYIGIDNSKRYCDYAKERLLFDNDIFG